MKGFYMAAALLVLMFSPSKCDSRFNESHGKSIAEALVGYLEARSK